MLVGDCYEAIVVAAAVRDDNADRVVPIEWIRLDAVDELLQSLVNDGDASCVVVLVSPVDVVGIIVVYHQEPWLQVPHAPQAKLRQESGGLDKAEVFLEGLAESTPDPYSRAEYLKALDEVSTERRARLLDEARVVYVERTGRDIDHVEDLLARPEPVLRMLPPAHPHFPGVGWEISEEAGEIVSSFYGVRYRPHEHQIDRERRERWRRSQEGGES